MRRAGLALADLQDSAILRFLVERDQNLISRPGRFPFRPPYGFLLRRLGQFFFVMFFPIPQICPVNWSRERWSS
jgi:hypothetical protein